MSDMMKGFNYDLYVLYSQITGRTIVIAKLVATKEEFYIQYFSVHDKSHEQRKLNIDCRGNLTPIKIDIGTMRPIENLYTGAKWKALFSGKIHEITKIEYSSFNGNNEEIKIHFGGLKCPFKFNDAFFDLFIPITN